MLVRSFWRFAPFFFRCYGFSLGSTLLHELAHASVAVYFGGRVKNIRLSPTGAGQCEFVFAFAHKTTSFQHRLIALAGPVVEAAALAFCFWVENQFPLLLRPPWVRQLSWTILIGIALQQWLPCENRDGRVIFAAKAWSSSRAVWVEAILYGLTAYSMFLLL